MATVIKLKRSTSSSSVPTTSDLTDGEVAVNIADKKIYARNGGSIVEIANVDTSVLIANDVNNRIVTADGSSGLNGEANLTFDGSVLAATGNITATGTIEPAGDTAAGDNAAIGYTSAEGLILTGQGSTNDVTIKNDADADVIKIPTGTTGVTFTGTINSGAITSTGIVTGTGFTAGNAVLAEAELELLDGLTAGTAIASKVVTTDANIDTTGQRNLTITGELDAATLDISGNADIDGTLEADAYTVDGTALNEYIADTIGAMVGSNTETGIAVTYEDGDNTLDFVIGTLNQDTTGLAATATALATARTIGGTSFDGTANIAVALAATATALADTRTIGGVPFDGTANVDLFAAEIKIGEDDQTKVDFETADEIHFYAANAEQVYVADGIFGPQTDSDVDLGTSGVRFKDAYVDSITVTGEVDGASLDISGNADIDGILEADAITVDGTTLAEYIADTIGAMVGSNTETGIAVTYQDGDNTLDFVIGTLNQDTTGNAATATALETARTIGGTSFDGTANIAVALASTATTLATARTIGGTSFDGSANIAVALAATATALASARTIHGVSFDGTANIDLSEVIADTVGAMVGSNTETGITVTYQDGDNTIDFVVGTLNQDTTGTADNFTVSANNSTDETVYPVFVDGATGSQGAETDTGLSYNPSSGNLTIGGELVAATLDISGNVDIDGTLETDALTIDGVTLAETIADTVGAMVGSNTETGITVTYEDGDNTLDFVIGTLNQDTTGLAATATALATARTIGGTSFDGTANIAVALAATATTLATARTIGGTSFDGSANIAVALAATATALASARTIHGVSFDGTANIDLTEVVQDTVGAMFSSNTETGIAATYQDGDGTIDLVVGTLNQDTTGNAATATALETARTIGGTSFDGSANIAVALAATATTLATARTIGGTSFDGSANIAVALAATATALASARTIGGVSFDGTANIDLLATDIKIGEDDQTKVDFETADEIHFYAANAEQVYVADGVFGPQTDSDVDLGTTGVRFKDAYVDSITVTGEVDGASLDISGNADIDGTLEADAITVDGTTLAEYIADTIGAMVGSNTETGIAVTYQDGDNTLDFVIGTLNQDTTGTSDNFTVSANNSTDETVYPVFVDGATGSQGAETDTGLSYNPSSGVLTTTSVTGNLTGDVTGNVSGTAATVTTAAQTNITSLGTLTALTVDDVAVNGKVITMTGSSSDTAVFTAGTNGTLSIVTTDAAAAAANIQITADGTVDIDSAGVLTLDSGAAINIEPASGSAILLDGTISIDAGVITGATSITSTAFVGDITGDVTGNTSGTAATVTGAAQSNITSLGTLTTLTVDDMTLNGSTISDSGDFTIDCGADIILDADGGNIKVKDNGTTFFDIQKSSDDAQLLSRISDGDLVFRGNDGGTTITALTLDMSEGGVATFNDKVVATELDISGNADIDGTLEADAYTVDGTALNEYIADTVGAMVGSNTETGIAVTYEDGDNTLDFVLGAAQTTITSLGTLTALTVDDVVINGKVITMTGSSSDTAVFTAGTNGTLSIVTTDDAAAAANIQITADGTVDIDSAGVLTLDSGAAINIEPAAGSAILLDGTISVDAGVVTGATSITSTAFVGDITGDVTGNASGTAATVTGAAQSSITSLGTLTTLTVDSIIINGTNIGHTSDTDAISIASNGKVTFTQEIVATSLDISGNVDIDGTLETDALTIDGTALDVAGTAAAMALALGG